jgi:Mn2+/Fe2+ NRAMP family transporter
MPLQKKPGIKWSGPIMGAAFLMATSAIGPGFLTQTSLFTQDLLSSFGFVILISILLDIGAQLNIWRIIVVSSTRAQDLANKILPRLGYFLATLIAFGGLVFNVGNISGCGLGLNVLTGITPETGAIISCIIAIGVFWYKEAGRLIDVFAKILGLIMIAVTAYIALSSNPPLGEALYRTVWPERIDILKIVTIVGGTVGGYISFAGAHRLLDAGYGGKNSIKDVSRSAVSGIIITSTMRFVLFLAVLGIVTQGIRLSATNPASTVFSAAVGAAGYKFFGVVLWCAAITSVVGASYTSISFWKTLVPAVNRHEKIFVTVFILVSTIIFLLRGNPVELLVFAGAVNGIILPMALAVILLAVHKSTLMKEYRHPLWMIAMGWLVVVVLGWMSYRSILQLLQ